MFSFYLISVLLVGVTFCTYSANIVFLCGLVFNSQLVAYMYQSWCVDAVPCWGLQWQKKLACVLLLEDVAWMSDASNTIYTVSQKTSPTFLTVTWKPIIKFRKFLVRIFLTQLAIKGPFRFSPHPACVSALPRENTTRRRVVAASHVIVLSQILTQLTQSSLYVVQIELGVVLSWRLNLTLILW